MAACNLCFPKKPGKEPVPGCAKVRGPLSLPSLWSSDALPFCAADDTCCDDDCFPSMATQPLSDHKKDDSNYIV